MKQSQTLSKQTEKGNQAEELVTIFLQKRGCTLVARNYRKRYGEIDIIMRDNNTLMFIEVKRRDSSNCDSGYIDAAEVVIPSKQKKIILVAKEFIATHTEFDEMIYRFDVALVDYNSTTQNIRYIENAFTAD